jgi:predicted metalloendopeptidase
LGENIGDLGGINAAYDGLQLYLKENGTGLIDGTHQSLYVLGYNLEI